MKNWIVCGLLAVLFVSLATTDADAQLRRWRRVRYTSVQATGAHMEYTPTAFSTEKRFFDNTMSLQDIAQARANEMAARGSLDHNIHAYSNVPSWTGLGILEGIGCSTVRNPRHCATCICGSRVVADAYAFSRNGMVYRVRFFR